MSAGPVRWGHGGYATAAAGGEGGRRCDVPDDPVGTLAQLLGDVVALINDEILVKDLEDLPTLQIGHCDRGEPRTIDERLEEKKETRRKEVEESEVEREREREGKRE